MTTRSRILILGCTVAILAASLISLSIGATDVNNFWNVLLHPFTSTSDISHQVIWQIRAPRIAAALAVGVLLSIAGVLAQASTNNPLADPAIIGTSAGASLGALFAISLNIATVGTFAAFIAAAIGAVLATTLVFWLSRSAIQFIIIGIAISAILSSLVGLGISLVDREDARSITFWSFGSLALVNWSSLQILLPTLALTVLLSYLVAPSLDLLSLGDRATRGVGIDPQAIRGKAFAILALAIAATVSAVGSIAFLALAAPHIARRFVGPKARVLIPAAALIGALILLLADTAARTIAVPQELPIGLLTALIGAPILIVVLKKSAAVWR